MPQEAGRTTKRKRVQVGDSYVDVPVITKISFIDPFERYQEYQYEVNNGLNTSREVTVDRVYHSENGINSTDRYVDVERVKIWPVLDPFERHQETRVEFDNVTGNDDIPPHFRVHIKTHVVRYKNPDSPDSVWIDSELIDQFSVIDPHNRYQETFYTLNNPQTDDDAQADPADEDVAMPGGSIDPPWRIDPFQNIVNVSSYTPHRRIVHTKIYYSVCQSGHYPPLGYEGAYLNGYISAADDENAALAQAQLIVTSLITNGFPGHTIEDVSGILTGPQASDPRCFSFSVQWRQWTGDGYNFDGSSTDIPEDQYVTDSDLYYYARFGEPISTTDPGPYPF